MRFRTIIGLSLVLFVASTAMSAPIASSTFDTGGENWRVLSTLGFDGPVSWLGSGGNPDGFIYAQDPDTGAFGFSAPAKFLGPVPGAYGNELTFDIASYEMPAGASSWVGMRGGPSELELICDYDAPTSVYPAWHSRSVTMTESAGWVRVSDGQAPTHAEFMSVLNGLHGLVIVAEFVDGLETDVSGLDNVILVPEPATMVLCLLSALAFCRRKR